MSPENQQPNEEPITTEKQAYKKAILNASNHGWITGDGLEFVKQRAGLKAPTEAEKNEANIAFSKRYTPEKQVPKPKPKPKPLNQGGFWLGKKT